ncbi:MAG TPA: YHS domain-containing (seleno)protein [Candidatus Sulfotelmatobacter sp.]|jgi:YHS domain-containing protein|nr:YHS domain-containing (seleno)protein [Candidatus Sulfotelmatobacter sp.]
MKLSRIVFPAALALAVTASPALAGKVPLFNQKGGAALHGYDPVTYFSGAAPQKGSDRFPYSWKGATWYFVSAENRKKFAQTPEAFAPQYGGYCAKAVSENNTADIDPLAYKIVNGKLYVNYDAKIQKVWEADIPGRIAKADGYWPALHVAE